MRFTSTEACRPRRPRRRQPLIGAAGASAQGVQPPENIVGAATTLALDERHHRPKPSNAVFRADRLDGFRGLDPSTTARTGTYDLRDNRALPGSRLTEMDAGPGEPLAGDWTARSVTDRVHELLGVDPKISGRPMILAIDGRSGSGGRLLTGSVQQGPLRTCPGLPQPAHSAPAAIRPYGAGLRGNQGKAVARLKWLRVGSRRVVTGERVPIGSLTDARPKAYLICFSPRISGRCLVEDVQGFLRQTFRHSAGGLRPSAEPAGPISDASVAVTIEGEFVVDVWGGWADAQLNDPDQVGAENTISNVWSTTKTMTALSALVLVERGELNLDAPVADYWPEFAANGARSGSRVRHVHVPHLRRFRMGSARSPSEDIYDWDKSTEMLAAQGALVGTPAPPLGYHMLNYGHLRR